MDFLNDFIQYKGNNCIKFMGVIENGPVSSVVNESIINKIKNTRRFKTNYAINLFDPAEATLDIDISPLGHGYSIAHEAMQFILFTNPKKIYLVGCDCTLHKETHFIKSEGGVDIHMENELVNKPAGAYMTEKFLEGWDKIKQFAEIYYPETEIISINPVGLKSMFKNIYTRNLN
jgi:hypothetical protein